MEQGERKKLKDTAPTPLGSNASLIKQHHTAVPKEFQFKYTQNDILNEFGGYCQFLLLIKNNLYSSLFNFEAHKRWHATTIVIELFQRKLDNNNKTVPFRQSKNLLLSWLKFLITYWYSNEHILHLCDVSCFNLENLPLDNDTIDPTSTGPGSMVYQENFSVLKEIKYFMLFFRFIRSNQKLYPKQQMLANNIYNIFKYRYNDRISFKYTNAELNLMLSYFNKKLDELIVKRMN